MFLRAWADGTMQSISPGRHHFGLRGAQACARHAFRRARPEESCGAVADERRLRELWAPLFVLLLLAKPDWRFGEGVYSRSQSEFAFFAFLSRLANRKGCSGLGAAAFRSTLGSSEGLCLDACCSGISAVICRRYLYWRRLFWNKSWRKSQSSTGDSTACWEILQAFYDREANSSLYLSLNATAGAPGAGLR